MVLEQHHLPRLERWFDGRTARLILALDQRRCDLTSKAPGSNPLDLGRLTPARLAELAHESPTFGPSAESRLLTPLDPKHVGKILALGKNFREHAAEFGEAPPEEPLFFNKLPETLVPSGALVRVAPWYGARVDHEAELALVIQADGRDIPAHLALDHVFGYTIANDITARTLQGDDRKLRHPWFRAKNMDGFCPLGPGIVPAACVDPAALALGCRVRAKGQTEWSARQAAHTRDLIVSVPQAIAWLSRHLTLHAGDVILMGTPAGVGPLEDGAWVQCWIEGFGELVTFIERPVDPAPS